MSVEQCLSLLGFEGEDEVTGVRGTVTSVCFDLYGGIQVVLTQKVNKRGKVLRPHWIDVTQLSLYGNIPVMKSPDFLNTKGPAEKSIL